MRNIRLLTVIAAAAMGLSACSGTGVKTADQTAGNAAAQETEGKETAGWKPPKAKTRHN